MTDRAEAGSLDGVRKVAATHHTSLDALALAAALSQPWADVVLSGAVTTEQLASNVMAMALARESLDWPDLTEAPTDYWARRSALPWQ